ncbi:MAG: hypothetical protein BWK78_06850 [Thiotrichaceae bacterium IS1]|nr:MAG: hypothetical protein BWK78_06850 [Thiotrichaceae bacterium IS1]
MLMVLTEKALEKGISNYTPSALINCLENILKARFEGKHIVLANSGKISPSLSNLHLCKSSEIALEKIFDEFPQYGGLRDKVASYLQIVEPSRTGIEIIRKNQQTIVEVPIWYFGDTEAIQKTILLTENQEDAKLYIHLLEAYLTTNKVDFEICVEASTRGAGGNNIKSELDQQCHSKTFCLSIVDNDRYGPDDALGETAKRVQSGWQDHSGWHCKKTSHSVLVKVVILKVREIENLIPTRLIREALPKSMSNRVNALEHWEEHCPKEWRKFIDLKKGLRGYDVLHWQKGSLSEKCWSEFMVMVGKQSLKLTERCKNGTSCAKRKDCECLLWGGLGDEILSQVIEYFGKHNYHNLAKKFFDFQDESLKELTEELLAWCCALERIRC